MAGEGLSPEFLIDLPVEVFNMYWQIFADKGKKEDFEEYSKSTNDAPKRKEPVFSATMR